MSIILRSDSYKFSHYKQYPPNTNTVYSYFESRGGEFTETVFFGLQMLLKKHLEGAAVTKEDIDYAEKRVNLHMGGPVFNRAGWEYILNEHGGRLPVRIKAVPEGTVVPTSNVLMTIENTDQHCYWLPNFLETLLVQTWYPSTVATQSREMKKMLLDNLRDTGDPATIDYKLHDFGFRGVSCVEQAGIGGCAHLVNFRGTDTFEGVEYAYKYYGEEMAGHSIPASEHSTITSWGADNELDALRNMLQQYPEGLVACVSDSYDIYRACEQYWGTELKDQILNRDGCLVVRPDSGDPPVILKKVFRILFEKFGYEINEKGYRVLPPQVRVIQGDGIDRAMLSRILFSLKLDGISGDNIAFGSGGGLLQKMDRDTSKYAFKCSSIERDGKWLDVYKDPVTGKGKKSKRGRLKLVYNEGEKTYTTTGESINQPDQLVTVFENGELIRNWTFGEIQERAAI